MDGAVPDAEVGDAVGRESWFLRGEADQSPLDHHD